MITQCTNFNDLSIPSLFLQVNTEINPSRNTINKEAPLKPYSKDKLGSCVKFFTYFPSIGCRRVGDRAGVIDRTDDINVPPQHNVCTQFMLQYHTNYNAPLVHEYSATVFTLKLSYATLWGVFV